MVVSVFRDIFFLIPGIFLQFSYVIGACIYNQIAVLLNPSKLELDSIQNLYSFVRFYKVVHTAMKTFVLSQFCDRSSICTINKGIFCKSPILSAFLQKLYEFYGCIGRSKRLIQILIAVYFFSQCDQSPVLCDSLEYHCDCVRRL